MDAVPGIDLRLVDGDLVCPLVMSRGQPVSVSAVTAVAAAGVVAAGV